MTGDGASLDPRYFARLEQAVKSLGEGAPRLLIDAQRLDANVDRVCALLDGRALRIVVKSLPSVPLLRRVSGRAGTQRFMCFHWPFLVQIARQFANADILMGKPMPIAAVEAFFRHSLPERFDACAQVAWLIDSQERLSQYLALARSRDLALRVALEIDVGMHRGGVTRPAALEPLLSILRAHPSHLRLAGFMGYDAHTAKAPWPHRPRNATRRSAAAYALFVEFARRQFPDLMNGPLLLNGAGSPTFAMHDPDSPLTEVSVGSALVKPTDFEYPSLEALQPAAWIATPVIKRLAGLNVPFLERWSRLARNRDTLFVYGGRWMAQPVWPPQLRANSLYGLSSNQQFMSVPSRTQIGPDDFVFLRPTQSEAVLLEFGDLVALESDGSIERWPVLEREVR